MERSCSLDPERVIAASFLYGSPELYGADVSTIVAAIHEPVTSFQASAIVTEQGIAEIWGRSDAEQARLLIDNAAHPAVRDELRCSAETLGLGPAVSEAASRRARPLESAAPGRAC